MSSELYSNNFGYDLSFDISTSHVPSTPDLKCSPSDTYLDGANLQPTMKSDYDINSVPDLLSLLLEDNPNLLMNDHISPFSPCLPASSVVPPTQTIIPSGNMISYGTPVSQNGYGISNNDSRYYLSHPHQDPVPEINISPVAVIQPTISAPVQSSREVQVKTPKKQSAPRKQTKRKNSSKDKDNGKATTAEAKKLRRLEKNREAAQQFRQRQKTYIAGLETSVKTLEQDHKRLQQQMVSIDAENETLRAQLEYVRKHMTKPVTFKSSDGSVTRIITPASSVPVNPDLVCYPTSNYPYSSNIGTASC